MLKALRNPRAGIAVGMALAKGMYYRVKYKVTGQRVIIGKRFRVTGRLDIRGPGLVIFGDDCGVVSSFIQPTTPWTHSPNAVIRFGDKVLLTGTRLGCENAITVGDWAGLSDARIIDSDFHTLDYYEDRPRYNTSGRSKPIVIGKNVWVGAGAMIMKGVKIGDNSVVAAGSVVVASVPENTVVLGNPARVVTRIKSLGKFGDPPPASPFAPRPPVAKTTATAQTE